MLETEIKKIRVALERIADALESPLIEARPYNPEGTVEGPLGQSPAMQASVEEATPEPIGIDDKLRGLIALSKEMGYDYIYNAENNQLAVDNQVLNEWRRRHEGGDNSPDNEVPV